MRLVVFFGCVFLLLLGGYTYIYTGGQQNSICHTKTQPNVKLQQKKFTNTDQDHTIIGEANPDKEEGYLIGENIEEEDTDNLSARKYRLLANCYLTRSCHLRYLYSCPEAPLNFFSPLSYKYITQGVLRI